MSRELGCNCAIPFLAAAFGMNVGGVPWTEENDPDIEGGFLNVMKICGIVFLLLLCFALPSLYARLSTLRGRLSHEWSFKRNPSGDGPRRRDYIPI